MRVENKFGRIKIKALPLQTQTRAGGERVSAKQALVAMRMKEIFPRGVAGIKIIFVSLQSRSLHERVRLLRGQDSEKWGAITRSLRSLIYNKLCSARHEFLGNKE